MVDCIVFRKSLSDILRSMNMEYHPDCCKYIIKEAWHLLDDNKAEDLNNA